MKKVLKEVVHLQSGVYIPSSDYDGLDAMHVVGLRDFDDDLHFLETSSKVKPELVKDKYIVEESDVLFSTRMKFNAFRLPLNISQVYVASNSFVIIKPNINTVLPEYLTWYLNHPKTQMALSSFTQATGRVPYLSLRKLEEFVIDLPEMSIQKDIASLYGLWEKEKQLTKKLLKLKEAYLQEGLFNC